MEKLTVFSLFCLLFAVQAQSYRKNTHVYKEVGSMRIEADVFQPVAGIFFLIFFLLTFCRVFVLTFTFHFSNILLVAASYPVVLAFHSGGYSSIPLSFYLAFYSFVCEIKQVSCWQQI